MWDFTDYSGNDIEVSLPLLLSERSQQLLLAVVKDMQSRNAWVDGDDDANYDEIQAAIADAINELIVEVIPLSDNTPVGSIIAFIGLIADIPAKWLPCNNTTYVGADYPELFSILKATFISGSNFHTPNLQGHFIRGAASDSDHSGESGSNTHTLSISELPAHHHVVPAHAHTVGTRNAAGANVGSVSMGSLAANNTIATDTEPATDTSDVGSGDFFNIEPLSYRFHWIIKALP